AGSTMPNAPRCARFRRRARSALARASCAPRPPRSPPPRCGWGPLATGGTRPRQFETGAAPADRLTGAAMSTRKASAAKEMPIERREQLVAPMQAGERPPADWRIGTEHEKLVYSRADFHAPSYDEPGGIRDILLEL